MTTPNRRNGAAVILLAFVVGGVFDLVWGYIHERSVVAGVVFIILGLFGTAWYLLLFGASRKDD